MVPELAASILSKGEVLSSAANLDTKGEIAQQLYLSTAVKKLESAIAWRRRGPPSRKADRSQASIGGSG